jgi:hypothetical protein
MRAGTLQTWITRQIAVRQRLARICTSYLLFLMVATTKHSLKEAARFSGLHPSLCAKLLQAHAKVAITTLDSLSKTQARQLAKTRERVNGLPWKIMLILDSTLQHRASLHPENAKTFNHGKGYVIGHQWTNIVVLLGDMLIPLRPIPFYSKRYCQAHGLAYHSEHVRVVDYLHALDLADYIGSYDRRDVLVLADSGYDDKKIEKTMAAKGWHFIIALSKTRSVKSATGSLSTSTSQQWCPIATFFCRHAGSSGPPFVSRRVGPNASEWRFASDTPQASCATWARSSWCVPNCATGRMGAASIWPAMI